MIVIAHLSDPHLDGTDVARDRLRRITSYLKAFRTPVDVVLVSGDLTDHGLAAEYDELAAELPADVPVLVIPGNHDVSAPLRAGLADFLDSPARRTRSIRCVRLPVRGSCCSTRACLVRTTGCSRAGR